MQFRISCSMVSMLMNTLSMFVLAPVRAVLVALRASSLFFTSSVLLGWRSQC